MSSRAVGEITLIYNDHFLEQRKYRCVADRRNIIEAWGRKYKPQWSRCVFLITPDVESDMTHSDGTNLKLRGYKEPGAKTFKNTPLLAVKDPRKHSRRTFVTPERFS